VHPEAWLPSAAVRADTSRQHPSAPSSSGHVVLQAAGGWWVPSACGGAPGAATEYGAVRCVFQCLETRAHTQAVQHLRAVYSETDRKSCSRNSFPLTPFLVDVSPRDEARDLPALSALGSAVLREDGTAPPQPSPTTGPSLGKTCLWLCVVPHSRCSGDYSQVR